MPPRVIKPPANLLYEEQTWKKVPAGAKSRGGYRRWHLPLGNTLEEILSEIDSDGELSDPTSLSNFNFATDKIGNNREGCIHWYLLNYAGFTTIGDKVYSDADSWLWVLDDENIEEEMRDHGALEKAPKEKPPPPPLPPSMPRSAVRSEQNGPKALTTVDQKFLPGDVLLSEHQEDSFIQGMTLAWPTHAGICVDPDRDKAVDANAGRGDKAVRETGLNDFFHSMRTPGGGLVYRYVGGAEAARKAAKWALEQTGRKYHFTLKSSILGGERDGGKRNRFEVPERKFDPKGEAVDDQGKPAMIETKSKGKIPRLHDVYCAELVWRAYRFGAGVVLVDPKKFFCLFDHPNRAIVGLLSEFGAKDEWKKIEEGFSTFPGNLVPNPIARNRVIKRMRSRFAGYLCAPHQFLESKQLKKVRRFAPDMFLKKHVVWNFHLADVHPRDVAHKLIESDAAFELWCKTKGKACKTSVDDPLQLQPMSKEGSAGPGKTGGSVPTEEEEED